ncbi:MAG TPA: ATP-binding protein [Puia sp.]|nr:ATP-binding protein [Puia sp.]
MSFLRFLFERAFNLFFSILLMLFLAFNHAAAQDSTVALSGNMFEKSVDAILLGGLNGWAYKGGNDTGWAAENLNTSSWKRLRPTDVSAKYADNKGRFEGWFRLRVKPSPGFKYDKLGITYNSWAAAEIYLNGKFLRAFGNLGTRGRPFKDYTPKNDDEPAPIDLKPGTTYTIAVHMVDYLAAAPPARLKMEDGNSKAILVLTGPQYSHLVNLSILTLTSFASMWVAVSAILSLLFMLMAFLSRTDKSLRTIVICSIFYLLSTTSFRLSNSIGFSYMFDYLNSLVTLYAVQAIFITIPFIIAAIFERRISRSTKIFLAILSLINIVNVFLPPNYYYALMTGDIILLSVCVYYIASAWKKLHGAQWSIVIGLTASPVFLIVGILARITLKNTIAADWILLYFETAFVLAFPVSMLIYVVIRFREMVREVRQHADEVIRLSEEKREEALNRQKLLQEEVDRQTAEIRANQVLLVQQEKMASLGELTAGIAHEIQNPLNFVNNFSDVNSELLAEAAVELENGNSETAKSILSEIKENEIRINHHGKRAESIVKGMLQHSRVGAGEKAHADINAIVEECLKLSLHNLRAKDKSFDIQIHTDFDRSIGNLPIVPQEMVRVFVNLFNNAFYAVAERKKSELDGYVPRISVATKKAAELVTINVKDNGSGIPPKIIDKIFQPFFTTKPPGQGTGLGLSLSYDIIKAHGGQINVESAVGKGSEFVIKLPLSN